MIELFTSIGKLAIGFLCILGPFVLLIAFLRTRDLREAALSTTVLQELNSPNLRGLFSIEVKSRPIGADTVIVDLWSCSREQVWDLIERLSSRLPAHVRVEVNGISGSRLNSEWTLTVRKACETGVRLCTVNKLQISKS
jgi:hypothetical protein